MYLLFSFVVMSSFVKVKLQAWENRTASSEYEIHPEIREDLGNLDLRYFLGVGILKFLGGTRGQG